MVILLDIILQPQIIGILILLIGQVIQFKVTEPIGYLYLVNIRWKQILDHLDLRGQ